jgi:hypothetical protein
MKDRFPIERINEFLKTTQLTIVNPFGSGFNKKINLTVKIKLTGD